MIQLLQYPLKQDVHLSEYPIHFVHALLITIYVGAQEVQVFASVQLRQLISLQLLHYEPLR